MTGARGVISVLPFVFLLFVVRESFAVGAEEEKFEGGERLKTCSEKVISWAEEKTLELSSRTAVERVKLRDFLFFLHIPRTGGRTFYNCFLKELFNSNELCPPSYTNLKIDGSKPGCRLMSTHDDYSFVDSLGNDTASVITNIREPLDRVISAYEFSVEVAARSLRNPKARRRQSTPTSQTQINPTPSSSKNVTKPAFVGSLRGTVDIWPWKYLVPLMEKDLFARRDARLLLFNTTEATGVSVDDSYDAAQILMPFREFIHHKEAHEVVHNGATFQVAGLTNTSFSESAHAIRSCVIEFPLLGKHVLEVAKKRLDNMFYVGITGRDYETAIFLMKVLGDQIPTENVIKRILHSRWNKSPQKFFTGQPNEQKQYREHYSTNASLDGWDKLTEEEVIKEMLDSFGSCVAGHRLGQQRRKYGSLETIKPVNFSREIRNSIPDSVRSEVSRLNVLDSELYAHAEVIFEQQQKLLELGDFHFWKHRILLRNNDTTQVLEDNVESNYTREHLENICHLIPLWGLAILFVLAVLIYTVTKHRSARVKKT